MKPFQQLNSSFLASQHKTNVDVAVVVKVEFQQRGTPHPHMFLWEKDAPKYGVDSDEDVCKYIDKYVHCSIPSIEEDEELHHLVTRCQVHRCLKSKCKKKQRACKYHFPRYPSEKTLISKGRKCDEYLQLPVNVKKQINEIEGKINLRSASILFIKTCDGKLLRTYFISS